MTVARKIKWCSFGDCFSVPYACIQLCTFVDSLKIEQIMYSVLSSAAAIFALHINGTFETGCATTVLLHNKC